MSKSFFKTHSKPAPNPYTHLVYETIEIDDNIMMVPLYILNHFSELNKAKSANKKDVADFFTKIMTVDQGKEKDSVVFDEQFLSEEFKSHYYNENQHKKLFNNPNEQLKDMIAAATRYNKYKQLIEYTGPLSFPGMVPKMIPITNNGGDSTSSGNDDNDANNLMRISDRNILG